MTHRLVVAAGRELPELPDDDRPLTIEVRGDWRGRELVALLRICDGAEQVVAAEPVARRLRRGGHRGPICGSADGPPVETDELPEFRAERLWTGTGHRRRSRPRGPSMTPDQVRATIEGAADRVPRSWDDYVAAHLERFVHTFALLPGSPRGGRALDASAFPLSIHMLNQLGYWTAGTLFAEDRPARAVPATGFWTDVDMAAEVWYDAEVHRLPCEDDMFDLVLAGEIIEHMPADPAQMLVEFNRVLRVGGTLVLTTPNITSRHSVAQALKGLHPFNYPLFDRHGSMDRHHQEFTPTMLATMVRRAGFHIEDLHTADVWFPDEPEVTDLIRLGGYDDRHRGDSLFVVARKVGGLVDRTPAGIYTGDEASWALSRRVWPRRGALPEGAV